MVLFSLIAVRAAASPSALLDPNDFTPLADVYAPSEVVIDTDALTIGPPSAVPLQGVEHDGVAVFAFGELVLAGPIEVRGSRPLALLTTGDLTLTSPLALSADGAHGGPGGFDARPNDKGEGAGRGRAFDVGTGAGFCGDGGDADDGHRKGGRAHFKSDHGLVGGSSGGSSKDDGGGIGGGGGGALELGALGRLRVHSTILARGGDGADVDGNAGGGGSGGLVVLHGGWGSECLGGVVVDGGAGGSSHSENGGGGGGAGCIVSMGMVTTQCALSAQGGGGGSGSAEAGDGTPAVPEVVLDADYDNDGVSLSEGDLHDLDPTIQHGPDDPDPDDPGTDDEVGPPVESTEPPVDPPGAVDATGDTAEFEARSGDSGSAEVSRPAHRAATTRSEGSRDAIGPGFAVCGHGPSMFGSLGPLLGLIAALVGIRRRPLGAGEAS